MLIRVLGLADSPAKEAGQAEICPRPPFVPAGAADLNLDEINDLVDVGGELVEPGGILQQFQDDPVGAVVRLVELIPAFDLLPVLVRRDALGDPVRPPVDPAELAPVIREPVRALLALIGRRRGVRLEAVEFGFQDPDGFALILDGCRVVPEKDLALCLEREPLGLLVRDLSPAPTCF